MKEKGYPGGYSQTREFVSRSIGKLRKELPPEDGELKGTLKKRDVVGWILRKPEYLGEEERASPDRLKACSEEFRPGCELARRFATITRSGEGTKLGDWMKAAKESGIRELKSFAAGLEKDRIADENGLTLSPSDGPVEGFNNRIKEIKRRMYGRAKFDPLRLMVLPPP